MTRALRTSWVFRSIVPLIPVHRAQPFRSIAPLKLDGLAAGLEEQLAQPGMAALSFDERVALLIDREVHARNDRKLVRLLKNARLAARPTPETRQKGEKYRPIVTAPTTI